MAQAIKILISCLLLSLPANTLFAYGAKVTIVLQTGEQITGEILYATKDTLIVSKNVWVGEEKLKKETDKIRIIAKPEIRDITLNGKSNVAAGIGMGLMAGLCVGILVNFNPGAGIPFSGGFDTVGTDQTMMIVFPLIGMALGTITGITTSTRDMAVDRETAKSLIYLRQFSRYQDEEPDFLIDLVASAKK